MFGFSSYDLGIDLGTTKTVIYEKKKNILFSEASSIAINTTDSKPVPVYYGEEAESMMGMTPEGLLAINPIRNGIITNVDYAAAMLKFYIQSAIGKPTFLRPSIGINCPAGANEAQKKIIQDVAFETGCKKVTLCESPYAAAIGLNLQINRARPQMIVDIGGGTTDIMVISVGRRVISKSIPIGGIAFDKAIVDYCKREHRMSINYKQAEDIKKRIGTLSQGPVNTSYIVDGFDVAQSMRITKEITADNVNDILQRPALIIISAIHDVLKHISQEMSHSIYQDGIYLIGGGAKLKGLDDYMISRLDININPHTEKEYDYCVAVGAYKFAKRIDRTDDSED